MMRKRIYTDKGTDFMAAMADTSSVGYSLWHIALKDGFAVDLWPATISISRNHPEIRAFIRVAA